MSRRRPAAGPADRAPAQHRRQRTKRRRLAWWQELPLLLVIAFCLAILIRSFLLQAFFIPSGSMEDTLVAGDRVLTNKVVYNFREPARGEVVVFRGTGEWASREGVDDDPGMLTKVGRAFGDLVGISRPGEKDYIKRVIGVPGDVVSCCDENGRVIVNGEPLDESYVIRDSRADVPPDSSNCQSRQFDEVVVEPGQMFVMGDHRRVSQDSRCEGQVPIDNVLGRAFVIVWPNDRWASLSAPATFTDVPPPVTAGEPDQAGQSGQQGAAPLVDPEAAEPPAGGAGVVLPLLLPLGAARSRIRASGAGGSGAFPPRATRPRS